MRGLFRRAVVVAGALVGMFAVAAAMVAAPGGMASASVAARHRLRPGSHPVRSSGMTLGQAPAGLRAAVRKRLGPLAAGGGSAFQKAKLIAAGGAAGDHFGWSVAVSGTTAVVGARNANSGTGAAYVFVHSGSAWLQETELTAAGGAAGDQFGYTVAISGSTVVVGAPGVSSDTGAAYVFVRSGTTWPQQAELADPGAAAYDYFGGAVAIYKSTVVVGADEGGNGGAGAAYVYIRSSAGTWAKKATLTAAGGASGDLFGASVAVSGSTVVVGAYASNSDTGAAYVFGGSGSSWFEQGKLTAAGGTANDLFGSAVAVSGSTVVVGAYGTNSGTGAAYVFVHSILIKGWTQQAELADPAAVAGDDFGDSVAISGSTAVIGAPDSTSSGAGAAYTFTRSGSTWSLQANLAAGPGAAGDDFGRSVAITGSTVLAGADGSKHSTGTAYVFLLPAQQAELADPGGTAYDTFGTSVAIAGSLAVVGAPGVNSNAGAAYVFIRSGTKWSLQATLADPGGAANDRFGTSVAIAGFRVVVGAPFTNTDTGAAYVFVQGKGNWSLQATLADPGGAAEDQFGTSVAIAAGSTSLTAVVGAPGSNSFAGAAYVYASNGFSWSQEAQLADPGGTTGDRFGTSVAIAGSTVVVGAPGVNSFAGAAYVYVGSGTAWSQQAELADPGGAAGDSFGGAVAIAGSTVVVGAKGVNTVAGAAYVFTRSGTTWSQQAGLTATDGAAGDNFGISVAISGSTVVVGAYANNSGTGAAYVFTRSGTAWSQQAELTATDGAAGDYFGISVAIAKSTAVIGAQGVNTSAGAAYVFANV